jgi:hypothetical protein
LASPHLAQSIRFGAFTLGLGTVVRREMPEPEIELTYLNQSGESNGEAGDPYAGLDRFGCIVHLIPYSRLESRSGNSVSWP